MYKKIVEFIHELYGTKDFVPLSVPNFIGNEKKYLGECIDTTFVSSVGQFVDRFEEDIAKIYRCEEGSGLCQWNQCFTYVFNALWS